MRFALHRVYALVAGATLLLFGFGCFKDPASSVDDPASIRLSDSSLHFDALGASQTVGAQILNKHEVAIQDTHVTWQSQDAAIAGVDSSGAITARANGMTWIVARLGGLSAQVRVLVNQVPAALVLVSDSLLSGEVASTLGQPVTVEVRDARGHGVSGGTVRNRVRFEANEEGRVEAAFVEVGDQGQAATRWTLGPKAGRQHLTATLEGQALKVECRAEATVGQPAKLVKIGEERLAGDTVWVGQVDKPLDHAIEVELRDAHDNAISGAGKHLVLAFTSTANGQALPATLDVDSNGRAKAVWRLGTRSGVYQLRVRLDGTDVETGVSARALPGPPVRLVAISGDTQIGAARKPLAKPLRAQVLDAFANPVPNLRVTPMPGAGQGTASVTSAISDSSGYVATEWTLGPEAGIQTLGMAAHDTLALTFHATSQIGSVTAFSDTQQVALAGHPVNVRPAVRLTDFDGRPLAGVGVTFETPQGGGTVAGGKMRTDSLGIARVGKWTLGSAAGGNQLIARVDTPQVPGNPVRFASSGKTAAFTIELRYLGEQAPSETQREAFAAAKARWESLIFGDLANISVKIPRGEGCQDSTFPAIDETMDDLVIYIKLKPIDGIYGTLGQASPCMIRNDGGLPIFGVIQFDTDDLANLESKGQFRDVALHEMGHVLGFGTLWNKSEPFPGFLENPCLSLGGCTTNPRFTGSRALAAYREIDPLTSAAASGVPVENCDSTPSCKSGTINSHWRESVFGTELMTGFLNPETANPLSFMTLASLWDLGYEVDLSGADTYPAMSKPLSFAAGEGARQALTLSEDLLTIPIPVVDAQGRTVRILRR